ncbi:MAG: hypothetical protein IT330_12345 [Anaerolineae bacterium]|nr:hypothetical protein [Anaerolineae bacterium]
MTDVAKNARVRKAWKQHERRTAKALNGQRTGPSGRAGPDVVSDWLCVECKHRKVLPQWLTAAAAKIRGQAGPNRLGITVLHAKGRRDSLVLLSLHDFVDWFGGLGSAHEYEVEGSWETGMST